ncbi:alpha-ribazole phosphatase [Inhella inkyongensis]|uniref:Alpha-ribazole phosphatase n=1 Tax=Inhella inkyongensis TaxID=392593 RepID=A0A840S147_9BURK|nr:histidine phosphatase family protein [Inhella inkyongensis]MBB5204837.1 alpha-ribazole phosphatase [Inhella inkyongensis]
MLIAYRHPKPIGAQGLCVGARTDLAVDPRKAKRLAHRIRACQRREALAREVWTSDLRRAADVGRWLRRWGWRHLIDARLRELDFGAWDGRAWDAIAEPEIRAWSRALADVRPGGDGETVGALVDRVVAVCAAAEGRRMSLLVTHGGWLSALKWRMLQAGERVDAANWPSAPAYAEAVRCS